VFFLPRIIRTIRVPTKRGKQISNGDLLVARPLFLNGISRDSFNIDFFLSHNSFIAINIVARVEYDSRSFNAIIILPQDGKILKDWLLM